MTDPSTDRGHLTTEQRLAASAELDTLSVEQTLRVINEQDTQVPQVVAAAIPAIAGLVERIVQSMRRGGRLIYIGAGTSGRLGVLDASECPPTFHTDPRDVVGIIAGGDGALRRSSEGKEDDPDGARAAFDELCINNNDVVVGIMAGGTTPYVWGALRMARERGAAAALLCCVRVAEVGELPMPVAMLDHVIELPVGAEVVTGSTRMKAGTATKLALNMISTAVMTQLGKVWGNLMVDVRASNVKLRDRAVRIIARQCELSREAAADLLDAAGGEVKAALVMGIRQTSADEARAMLTQHDGQLRPILGEPRG